MIDFSKGGTDTVQFNAIAASGPVRLARRRRHNYNNVLGFTNANDSVNFSIAGFAGTSPAYTNTALAVAAGDATVAIPLYTGSLEDCSTTHANYIDQLFNDHTTMLRRGHRTGGVREAMGARDDYSEWYPAIISCRSTTPRPRRPSWRTSARLGQRSSPLVTPSA